MTWEGICSLSSIKFNQCRSEWGTTRLVHSLGFGSKASSEDNSAKQVRTLPSSFPECATVRTVKPRTPSPYPHSVIQRRGNQAHSTAAKLPPSCGLHTWGCSEWHRMVLSLLATGWDLTTSHLDANQSSDSKAVFPVFTHGPLSCFPGHGCLLPRQRNRLCPSR